jgi:glutamine amidotransferase
VENTGPLAGLPTDAYAYFVHSYVAEPDPEAAEVVASTTNYGGPFVSTLTRDNIWGTQFHPEKSGAIGAVVLRNFVRRCSPGTER